MNVALALCRGQQSTRRLASIRTRSYIRLAEIACAFKRHAGHDCGYDRGDDGKGMSSKFNTP